ncbi:universal stress protein [Rhizobiaceae bacterium n13]|uniref:Universal stress protein n=1 Tax=Ferirhizobium litorale TaxID=2927786 RepID=A0AAE3U3I9_9HYPH|nr:universal stress protein [Fererhizobium litorale]MDI7862288.1 universal stress protein [Fererhizobium litorale]MDI7922438.1 universal stress protein [Fererhizobium litorale]
MFRNILVPTDGSPLSAMAVDKALAFAKETGAKVTLLMDIEPYHILSADAEQLASTREEYEQQAKAFAAQHLARVKDKAATMGVACESEHFVSGEPYRSIIDTATKKGCDLIAMASHGRRGISALVLGSVTTKVLTHSTIPVLVYR